jgi:undecaprenyl-diphosphatase
VTRSSLVTIALAAHLCLFTALALLAHRYAYFYWDLFLAHYIQSISLPGFHTLMISLSWMGTGWRPWVIGLATGAALFLFRYRTEGALLMAGCAVSAGMNRLLKLLIARPRPDGTLVDVLIPYPHESFPSGHVVFYVQYFGFLCFLAGLHLRPGRFRRTAIVLLLVPTALVGLSRVYLGAHWPSDALGGYMAGSFWLVLTIEAFQLLKSRKPKPSPEA